MPPSYDKLASASAIYAYAGNDPINFSDPNGHKYSGCNSACEQKKREEWKRKNAESRLRNHLMHGYRYDDDVLGPLTNFGVPKDRAAQIRQDVEDYKAEMNGRATPSMGPDDILPSKIVPKAAATLFGIGLKGGLKTGATKGVPNLDELSIAAGLPKKGNFTAAGRSLQKHSGRPGSKWDQTDINTNNPNVANPAAQDLVDDILTTPGTRISPNPRGGLDVVSPDGRVIRYNRDGSFQGFRE